MTRRAFHPGGEIRPLWWDGEHQVLVLLDQTRLPAEERYDDHSNPATVADAIRRLVVRGAPAIGCAAAAGAALSALSCTAKDAGALAAQVREDIRMLAATRPTAVNLFWALRRMEGRLDALLAAGTGPDGVRKGLVAEAEAVIAEDLAACRAMGDLGAELVPAREGGARILTHCNAGALATAGYGTALGVVRSAHRQGKVAMVWVDETRPVLQGARLTAWEMVREGIPATLICDNMAGSLMAAGKVDFVVVGADRITADGSVANKIGTYPVAALAARHGVPFVVAAPLSTVDLSLPTGSAIPIEERDPAEVTGYGGVGWAPAGMRVFNPAFDVTPPELVAAIVTERGTARPPFGKSLPGLFPRP